MTTLDDLERWGETFVAFHACVVTLFARREPREQAATYLQGLLAPIERKNGWQVAEVVGDATPDRVQRLLYRVNRDAGAAWDRLQAFVRETFGDPEGIGILDEAGFLKKGRPRWACSGRTAARSARSRTARSACSGPPPGHAGTCSWTSACTWPRSGATTRRAGPWPRCPRGVGSQTKPEQAIAMLEHAWTPRVPMRWVTGDEVYGGDRTGPL